MKKLLPLLLVLLVLAGCAQNDKTEETTTDITEPQTALETVADAGEQEVFLLLDDEDMTVSATLQDDEMQADFPATTTKQTTAGQTTTTAKADKESQNTTTTTTTKPAVSQNTTTTTKPAVSQKNTATTAANGTATTSSAATLPTADAEKGRYELPAIPLG